MKAKFKKDDRVYITTPSAKDQMATVTDLMQDEDNTWYYLVRVLFEDWVVEESRLKPCHVPQYSLECPYYTQTWDTIDELLDDIISGGMDPNYEITRDGKSTGETAFSLIQI